MAFTFKKNSRGFSNITFPFMRNTIIPTTNFLFNVRVTNRQNMPLTGPCFIYGNHSNYFDPFLLNVDMTEEPTAGVMTRDQFHKTIPRIFMDSIGIVPTSKYVPEPGIIRDVIRMIDQKRMIVIFPEGGRRWDGRPKPIIETTMKLFWKMNIPVHPVQLHGSYLGWPRWAKRPRRSVIEARWLDPLHASDYDDYDTFAKVCLEKIDFEEYNPPSETFPFTSWGPAKGIERLLYRCPESGVTGAVYTPSGDRVCSHTATFDYKMNNASRLIDRDGKTHSIIDLYDNINRMEMVMNDEKVLLEVNGSQFYTIGKDHQLIELQRGIVQLTLDGVKYSYGSSRGIIPLDRINYISVEQAHKLSITNSDRTLQFTLNRSSALQWQHYLRRLQKGEVPVTEKNPVIEPGGH
jgi:1-acyl-sn-glycerol-3-phosphate acyltransferase